MRNTYSATTACTFAGRTAIIVGVAALTIVYGFALFISPGDSRGSADRWVKIDRSAS